MHSIIALTGKMPEIFNMFSIIRNSRDLIKYNRNNDLNIFNGLKVLTMIVVLFGHKFLYFVINPITYGMHLEKVIQIIFCIGISYYIWYATLRVHSTTHLHTVTYLFLNSIYIYKIYFWEWFYFFDTFVFVSL